MPLLAIVGVALWAIAFAALAVAVSSHGRTTNRALDVFMTLLLAGALLVLAGNVLA